MRARLSWRIALRVLWSPHCWEWLTLGFPTLAETPLVGCLGHPTGSEDHFTGSASSCPTPQPSGQSPFWVAPRHLLHLGLLWVPQKSWPAHCWRDSPYAAASTDPITQQPARPASRPRLSQAEVSPSLWVPATPNPWIQETQLKFFKWTPWKPHRPSQPLGKGGTPGNSHHGECHSTPTTAPRESIPLPSNGSCWHVSCLCCGWEVRSPTVSKLVLNQGGWKNCFRWSSTLFWNVGAVSSPVKLNQKPGVWKTTHREQTCGYPCVCGGGGAI